MDPLAPVLAKALRFLSYRSRSEKEVREYLLGKTKPLRKNQQPPSAEIIDSVMQKLKEMRFVNDAEFAKAWVRSRTEYRPRAKSIIKMELRQKGIDDELIAQALAEIIEGKDDMTLARQVLEKRKKRYIGMEKQELQQKAGGFLARKGFSYDVIKAAIDSVFNRS